jgi:tetratricopeptide (TPR) repeat protein
MMIHDPIHIDTDWITALKRQEFERVDTVLNDLQRRFEHHEIDEATLERAFAGFHHFDAELTPVLTRWTQQHRRSYAASLARGLQLLATGNALSANVARLMWSQPALNGENTAFLTAVNFATAHLTNEYTRTLMDAALELTRSLDLTLKPLLSYVALIPLSPAAASTTDEALESTPYRRALALHPQSLIARRQMMRLLHPASHGAAQYQSMRHYLLDDPQTRLADSARRQLEAQLCDAMAFDAPAKEAASHLERAELLEPNPDDRTSLERARLLFRLGRFERAATLLEVLIARRPSDASLSLALAVTRLRHDLEDGRAWMLLERHADHGDALSHALLRAKRDPGMFKGRLKRLLRTLP